MLKFLIALMLATAAAATIPIPENVTDAMEFSRYPEMEETLVRLFARPMVKSSPVSPFIVGGGADERGQFPHQVLLIIEKVPKKRFLCGGSLIQRDWALTAAHCVFYEFHAAEAYVGASHMKGPAAWRTTLDRTDVFIHPDYNNHDLKNDIAMIKFASAPENLLDNPFVGVVHLPSSHDIEEFEGKSGTILGFGRFSDSTSAVSQDLKFNILPLLSNAECELYYPNGNIRDTNICGQTTADASTCEGDSGGPYTFNIDGKEVIAGITSFGATVGCEIGYPAAFTRVSKYVSWINEIIGGRGKTLKAESSQDNL